MPLALTSKINKAFYGDEFKSFILYAPLGLGKTALAIQCLLELYFLKDIRKAILDHGARCNVWDYIDNEKVLNMVKTHLVFHPKNFLLACRRLTERDKALLWDDAGLWLFSLDFKDPFVNAVSKFMSVARTKFGAIIFTTPHPSHVIKKIRTLPDAVVVKVYKYTNSRWLRKAKHYQWWSTPDGKKSGVRGKEVEKFSCHIPDFIYDWYLPLRKRYADMALDMMQKRLDEMELGDKFPELGKRVPAVS